MAAAPEPPAPDYAEPGTWAAWPGQPNAADSLPQGLEDPPLPAEERVDVFFIHPTTYLSFSIGNARYEETGATRSRLEGGRFALSGQRLQRPLPDFRTALSPGEPRGVLPGR